MPTFTIPTTELRPGDVLVWADQTETVTAVHLPDDPTTVVAMVETIRNGKPERFMSGLRGQHTVERAS